MATVIQSNTILTVNLISSVIWMLLWELLKQLLEAFESMHLGTDTSEKPLRLREPLRRKHSPCSAPGLPNSAAY